MTTEWSPDVLGEPFTATTLALPDDAEGELVATLVRRSADQPSRRAVLHVHGFCDYFFHAEYAEWWTSRGYDFYAVDLPKYGRSLRPHHTPNYVDSLDEYFPVLDAVWELLRAEHDSVVITAHSTGGLTVPLWADDRQPDGLAGLYLNSPWLDLQGKASTRILGTPIIKQLGRVRPRVAIPREVSGYYVQSLHRDYGGEWDFDLELKPLRSFAVHLGWLRAIRIGHAQLQKGLAVPCPVLVQSSDRSGISVALDEFTKSADVVLDVRQIRRWSVAIGKHVTYVEIPGAIHDIVLSQPDARKRAYDELGRWLEAYVE